jgi:hypothetical protein
MKFSYLYFPGKNHFFFGSEEGKICSLYAIPHMLSAKTDWTYVYQHSIFRSTAEIRMCINW